MKREYSIETNERKIYPLGVTKTPGGFDVAFVSEKSPALLLFDCLLYTSDAADD